MTDDQKYVVIQQFMNVDQWFILDIDCKYYIKNILLQISVFKKTDEYISRCSSGGIMECGSDITCFGINAGFSLLAGSNHTLLGSTAGNDIRRGENNLCVGYKSGNKLVRGSHNIYIGGLQARRPDEHHVCKIDHVRACRPWQHDAVPV